MKPTRLAMAASLAGGVAVTAIGEIRHDYSVPESTTLLVGMTAVGLLIEPSRKLGTQLETRIMNHFGLEQE